MPEITPLGRGRFLVTAGGRSTLAYAVRDGEKVWVCVYGRTFVLSAADGERAGSHREDDNVALAAPMPASVASIKVAVGDRVQAGDVLIVLEAMKMELPIAAPRDGIIKQIRSAVGELVQPGVPLVELE